MAENEEVNMLNLNDILTCICRHVHTQHIITVSMHIILPYLDVD